MLNSRARAAAALAAAAALTLTACGDEESPAEETTSTGAVEQVEVEAGTDDKAPTISLEEQSVSVEETEVKTLEEGKGAPVAKDDIVTMDVALFNGKDGKPIEGTETYTAEPLALDMGNEELFAGLRNGVLGQKVGSSAVAVLPPKEMFGESGNEQFGVGATDSIVMVYDLKSVMLKEAKGKEVKPKGDLPTVEYRSDQPAKITMPKGKAPKDTVVEPLIEGEGEKIEKGDTAYVTYTGALWKDGKVFDSSKNDGRRPFAFPVGSGQVIKAWDKAVEGSSVGDRLLLVVPPKDGYGDQGSPDGTIKKNDTIVFVVDILGKV